MISLTLEQEQQSCVSSPALLAFIHDLKKQAKHDFIQIKCDNAKKPTFSLLQDCSRISLHRPNSMPSLRISRSNRKAVIVTSDYNLVSSSSQSITDPSFNPSQTRRPSSMPTMTLRKSHSMSRWEVGCEARNKTSNAQWSGNDSYLPQPTRRDSGEDTLPQRRLHHSNPIHYLPKPKRRDSSGEDSLQLRRLHPTRTLCSSSSSSTSSSSIVLAHKGSLPDYQIALNLVRQKYGTQSACATSSSNPTATNTTFSTSSSSNTTSKMISPSSLSNHIRRTTVTSCGGKTSLPALPSRRKSIDDDDDLLLEGISPFDIVSLLEVDQEKDD